MDTRIKESIGKKTAFVVAINQIESANVSKVKIKETAAKLGLSEASAMKAYLNVTNSGDTRIDRRVKYDSADERAEFSLANSAKHDIYSKNASENAKKRNCKTREVSVGEMAAAILEMMTSKKRLYDILYDNEINVNQYYKALFELEVYGTLLGKKVLAYHKFNKFAIKDLIHIYKYPTGNMVKNLDLVEISTRIRAANILKNKLTKLALSK